MIPASSAYLAANARLQKQPVFLVVIEGYSRAFSSADIGGTYHQDIFLEVPNSSGPWDVRPGLNEAFDYDSHDWGRPVLYPRYFKEGDQIIITVDHSSGGISSPGYFGAVPTTGSRYPGDYVAGEDPGTNVGQLMGAWCGDQGNVIEPVMIGFGPTTLTCPAGSRRLQLGINDKQYNDNRGSQSILLQSVDSEIVPWLVSEMLQDLTVAVSDLDGGAENQGFIFNVQDALNLITADFPSFTFEGKKVYLLQGFRDIGTDDYVTLSTLTIDTVLSDNKNTEYTVTCIDALQNELAKSIYLTGDDGNLTDSDHPKTLNAHPMDILLQVLLFEVGLPPSRVDIDKIQLFRNKVYAGVQFPLSVTSPPAAKDFLQSEIMRPLGGYLRVNNQGIVTVNFMYPLSLDPVMTLNSDTLTDVPLEEQADLVNQVEFKFDYSDDDKPLADSVSILQSSFDKYGPGPLHTIEARGMRSGFQGFYLAKLVSRLIFLRYGLKNAKFEDSSSLINIWDAVRLEPGDLIALTCPLVPDREAGVMGITDQLMEILDRTYHFNDMTVGFTLLRVNFDSFRQSLITPDAEGDFTAVGQADQNRYMFLCGDDDKYSDGSPAKTLC